MKSSCSMFQHGKKRKDVVDVNARALWLIGILVTLSHTARNLNLKLIANNWSEVQNVFSLISPMNVTRSYSCM